LNQINTNWLLCGKVNVLTANILRLSRILSSIRFLALPALHAFVILTSSMIGSAWASGGYVYDAVGEVSLGIGKFSTRTIAKNDVIPSDAVVNTGDKSYAVLKFEDGQVAAMQANTAFHVREYRYEPKNPDKSNIVFSKFTGAMRFITGLIGQRNHHAFRLATPNATIGIQGTDFLVATLNNTLYGRILSGSISMTNEAGSVEFTAGQTILVASSHSLPVSIPASALPAGVFSQLDAIPIPPTVRANPSRGFRSGEHGGPCHSGGSSGSINSTNRIHFLAQCSGQHQKGE
jgi:hypothetical protein